MYFSARLNGNISARQPGMQGYVPVKNSLQEVACFVAAKDFNSVSVGNFLSFFQLWIIYGNFMITSKDMEALFIITIS